MSITITAWDRSPDGGKGLARDTRVRWALEELGVEYAVEGVSMEEKFQGPHLGKHPFGLIPVLEEGDLVLFESGAIILHLAEQHPGLLPEEPVARARAIAWMFAAVSSIEPAILELQWAKFGAGEQPFFEARMPLIMDRIRVPLGRVADHLGDADWLEGDFTAGDLMVVSVLQRTKPSGLLDEFPTLAAYVARAEARPAYARAFADQLAFNTR